MSYLGTKCYRPRQQSQQSITRIGVRWGPAQPLHAARRFIDRAAQLHRLEHAVKAWVIERAFGNSRGAKGKADAVRSLVADMVMLRGDRRRRWRGDVVTDTVPGADHPGWRRRWPATPWSVGCSPSPATCRNTSGTPLPDAWNGYR